LRAQVQQAHPGAKVELSSVCPSGYKPGMFFDLTLAKEPQLVQKIRHAYLPQPAGEVEFVLSCSADEFQPNLTLIMGMMGAFRVEPVTRPRP
jgi:hypothetical protein